MMYETLRYFAGEGSPTSDFTYADANDNHAGLDLTLPKATWNDPYDTSDGGFEYCAKPFMLVLSDINPTFDSDQLPGAFSEFGSQSPETIGNAGSSLDVEDLADDIFSAELSDGNRFIGQQGTTVDGACTEKNPRRFRGYPRVMPRRTHQTGQLLFGSRGQIWMERRPAHGQREAAGPNLCGRPGVTPSPNRNSFEW
jgi:type IV pilus assembly protein PilY1